MEQPSATCGTIALVSTKVFLLDDHEVVRRGLRDLLEASGDIEVVGEAGTAAEALARAPIAQADVAILDVRLPDGNGIEVCRELRDLDPGLRCIILTSFDDDDALAAAVLSGASAYFLKQIRSAELLSAVRQVATGTSLIDPSVARAAIERSRSKAARDERTRDLTPQELKILHLIAEGKTNRQIGAEMYLAEKTVKNYVSNVLAKMGFSRRTQAAVYAVRHEETDEAES